MSDCGCNPCPQTSGCGQRGLKVITLAAAASYTVTRAALKNTKYKGCRYDALSFTGGSVDTTVVDVILPAPASEADAYEITLENRSLALLTFGVAGGTDTFALEAFDAVEVSLEQEIANGASTMTTYRTRALVRPGGVYRVPGFTGPTPIG